MGLQIAARKTGNVTILDLQGRITIGNSNDALGAELRRLAEIAFQVNERTENIGARRLHTVLERLLDTISYDAPEQRGQQHAVDAAYVDKHLAALVQDQDLSRYIL